MFSRLITLNVIFRSLNAVFGHIGRTVSQEVVYQLVTRKCLPIFRPICFTEGMRDLDSISSVINQFPLKLVKLKKYNIMVAKELHVTCWHSFAYGSYTILELAYSTYIETEFHSQLVS